MPFEKEFIEVLLEASDEYNESMILDYTVLGNEVPTKVYADFAKKNINSPMYKTRISLFELFLVTHSVPNAWAWLHNDKYVMCIHLSLFKLIENRVKDKLKTLPTDCKEIISRCLFNKDEPADYLIYQFATVFTYYHELAHLYQFKNGNDGAAHFERYNLIKGSDFDKLIHAMEIDADIFAGEHMSAHLFQFWNAVPKEKKTKESLEARMALLLVSIFILFYELSDGWHEWYVLDYDHPNPLIRVCYILDVVAQTGTASSEKLDFEIDPKGVLTQALILANHFIADKTKNGFDDFVKLFQEHSEEINSYLKEEMFPYMDRIEFLNCNSKDE